MTATQTAFSLAALAALPGTRKLFHGDPYRTEARAEVLAVDGAFVVLNQSVFYGESGGQAPDHGAIDGLRVIDVQHRGGKPLFSGQTRYPIEDVRLETALVHELAEPAPFKPGDVVDLKIDWERRYANMRQHSACHFMYHAVQKVMTDDAAGVASKGCSITPDYNRMDFFANLPGERLADAEAYANALIAKGGDIVMEPEPLTEEVYYWRYGDEIVIPCGGTHVRSASELGLITMRRKKKGSNLTRITAEFRP